MINEADPKNLASASIPQSDLGRTTRRSRYTRNFFVIMAWSFIIITVLGFTPEYVMMISSTNGEHAHWFSHFHGALMSLWLILFLIQTILARKGNLKFHKQLGLLSIGFGSIMWITMIIATIRPRIQFPGPVGDERSSVLLIALHGLIFFGLFFTWGMLQRKTAPTHKRLMILASIAVMQGSVDRLGWFLTWTQSAFFVRFVHLDLLLLMPLIVYDLLSIKRIHMATLIGGVLIIAGQLVEISAEGTPTWQKECHCG